MARFLYVSALFLVACLAEHSIDDIAYDDAPFKEDLIEPTGSNVCKKMMNISQNSTEKYKVTEAQTIYEFCLDFTKGLRCPKEVMVTVEKTRPVTNIVEAEIKVCCKGYALKKDDNTCAEIPKLPSPLALNGTDFNNTGASPHFYLTFFVPVIAYQLY